MAELCLNNITPKPFDINGNTSSKTIIRAGDGFTITKVNSLSHIRK
jgi:hypothetical protein